MALDFPRLNGCLDETEHELLRVGRLRHEFLREESQLSAVILLLLRSISLFRAMLDLFQTERLDAFDAVRRAYLESWFLGFQLRIRAENGDAGRWLARRAGSWAASIQRLEEYARERGLNEPDLGNDYGQLSELAHPTRNAAENSAAVSLWRLGLNEFAQTVDDAIANLDRSIPAMVYRLLWLVLDEHETLVPLHLEERNMPTAMGLAEEFQRHDGNARRPPEEH
jgi:hypothetical protein